MERHTTMRALFLLLVLTLTACGGKSPSYIVPPEDTDSETDTGGDTDTDTDTDADTDSDSDSDTDTDTDTDTDSDGDTDTNTPPSGTWTLMMYFDGDNNLEEDVWTDANTIESVNIPPWLNIVLLFDRADGGWGDFTGDGNWTGTRLYHVQHDDNLSSITSPRLADSTYLGLSATGDGDELDMGSGQTLDHFIQFAQASFPADNYGLILSDHGDGWSKKSGGVSDIVKGCCSDDSSGNMLSVQNDIRPVIAGKGLDVIGFDACLMAMVEVAWALKDDTSYLVTSESTEPNYGWDYTVWLTDWIDGGTGSARDLVIDEVITYGAYYEPYGTSAGSITQSAIDISMLPALGDAIDAFMAADDPSGHLGSDIESGYGYYDLWEIANDAGDTALKTAVENAVIQNWHSGSGTPPAGLSIHFENSFPGEYTSIPFCLDTDWC